MPSDANKIQAFKNLIKTNPDQILTDYWQNLIEIKEQFGDDDENNADLIQNWLENSQSDPLTQKYNELLEILDQSPLAESGQMGPFRITPPSEPSLSLSDMIEQEVKRNTKLTENSYPPETKPDTKLDTNIEDSEKPLS